MSSALLLMLAGQGFTVFETQPTTNYVTNTVYETWYTSVFETNHATDTTYITNHLTNTNHNTVTLFQTLTVFDTKYPTQRSTNYNTSTMWSTNYISYYERTTSYDTTYQTLASRSSGSTYGPVGYIIGVYNGYNLDPWSGDRASYVYALYSAYLSRPSWEVAQGEIDYWVGVVDYFGMKDMLIILRLEDL